MSGSDVPDSSENPITSPKIAFLVPPPRASLNADVQAEGPCAITAPHNARPAQNLSPPPFPLVLLLGLQGKHRFDVSGPPSWFQAGSNCCKRQASNSTERD